MLLGPNGTKSSHMVHFHFGAHCLLSNAHPSKTPSSHSLFSVFPINHMLSQSQQGGSDLSSSIVTSTTNTRQPQNQLQAPRCPLCWDAIQRVKSKNAKLGLGYLRLVHRLGSGNIRSMYLVELKGDSGGGVGDSTKYMFAAKVMDKKELVSRNKDGRGKTERDIGNIVPPFFANTLCYIRHTYTSLTQAW